MNSLKIRAVIVDDESRIRRGIENLILTSDDDWEIVATFSDGEEMIETYQHDPFEFDILFTDIRMSIMDGLTLIKEMKKLTFFHPVVVSGFDDFTYLQTAIREGALDYLIKPIDREEFKKQLRTFKEKVINKRLETKNLDKVESQKTELMYMKQMEKLNELTKGYEIDLSAIDELGSFPKGLYALLHIKIDNYFLYSKSVGKNEWSNLITMSENVLKDVLSKCDKQYWKWSGDETNSFWILICKIEDRKKEILQNEVTQLAYTIQDRLNENSTITTAIAVSQIFTDLTMLQTLMTDVLTLVKYRLIAGNKVLQQDFHSELLVEKKEMKDASGEIQIEVRRILQSLDQLNEVEIKRYIALFVRKLQSLHEPVEIQLCIQSLCIQVINYYIRYTPRLDNDFINIQDTAALLQKTGDFTKLERGIEHLLLKVLHKLVSLSEEKVVDQVEIAKEWIVENIKENITIEKISKHVYMNPTYFCEYFKSQTGETVLDFVTRVRINKAKELLLSTNMKMYEISKQVGYADTKYFSKLFKKHHGIQPSKYKEMIKNK
ncbi:helix-turn-helix domain-containing protein [Evansella sp. AB-rgal1]|uniref:response regulator transcription factor n=1 Tax=Evansella sp. AB-rgal1 TaxID=3242696 RepID=UPI00359D82CB